jgi:hypothetical protein
VIQEALAAIRAGAREQDRLAYQALELAYITPSGSATQAATRLNVSRATFYRLLQRGLSGLAAALAAPPPT